MFIKTSNLVNASKPICCKTTWQDGWSVIQITWWYRQGKANPPCLLLCCFWQHLQQRECCTKHLNRTSLFNTHLLKGILPQCLQKTLGKKSYCLKDFRGETDQRERCHEEKWMWQNYFLSITLFFYLLKFCSVFLAAIPHEALLLLNFFLVHWPKVSSLPSKLEDAPVILRGSEKSMTANEFVTFPEMSWASWWTFLQLCYWMSYLPQRRGQKAVFVPAGYC